MPRGFDVGVSIMPRLSQFYLEINGTAHPYVTFCVYNTINQFIYTVMGMFLCARYEKWEMFQVSAWLGSVLGEDAVPQYEIDEHTIKLLDELRMRNEEQDRLTAAVSADYTQKANEYRTESEHF